MFRAIPRKIRQKAYRLAAGRQACRLLGSRQAGMDEVVGRHLAGR